MVGGCGCASPLDRFATSRRKLFSRTPRPLKMEAVRSFETSGNDYTVAELGCLRCCFLLFFFFTLDAGLLAISQYSEGPATGHLDTGFSCFPRA